MNFKSGHYRISVYNVFISAKLPLPDDATCNQICRAIYDAEWMEPARPKAPMRWFMRARVQKEQQLSA